ncbi:MAG: hypothetical protein ACK5KT_05970 [Dysgonomonas sp.]
MKRLTILVFLLFSVSSVNLFSQEKFIDILKSFSCIERKINLNNLLNPIDIGDDLTQINQDFRLGDKLYILMNNPTDSINLFCILSIETDSVGFEKLQLYSKNYFLIDKVNQKCFSFFIPHRPSLLDGLEADTIIIGDMYLRCENKISGGISKISEYSILPPYNMIMTIYFIVFSNYLDGRDIGNFISMSFNPSDKKLFFDIDRSKLKGYNIYKISYKEFLDLRDSFNK